MPLRPFSSSGESHSDFMPEVKTHSSTEVAERIQAWVEGSQILLFMKGTPKMPRCGFSQYVVGLLKFYSE